MKEKMTDAEIRTQFNFVIGYLNDALMEERNRHITGRVNHYWFLYDLLDCAGLISEENKRKKRER